MLKNIQKQLLLKYPLLWNTKFIPMLILGILFHLLYFTLGYIDGTIDFSNQQNINLETFTVLFGILFSIITIILWLVFYFKNNALKSFYKKSKEAIFYEWLQIFIICLLLTSFYLPFHFGKQLHQKSYFSLEETKNRCRIISNADFFIDGSFGATEIDSLASGLIDSLGNKVDLYKDNQYTGRQDYIYFDYVLFKGKKYNQYSLVNRNIFDFKINTEEEDSIQRITVQNWLHTHDIVAVKNLMESHLKILKEHHLETNLTLEKWFEITYNSPDFVKFQYIKPQLKDYGEYEPYNRYEESYQQPYQKYENSKYSKFYIQQNVLKEKYDIVSDAHVNPYFDGKETVIYLYLGLGLSLLVFSFRITSGKSWLIALITTGILNIIFGIFSALSSSEITYIIFILLIIMASSIYFLSILYSRQSVKLSRIVLNILLWSFSFFIPIIYILVLAYYDKNDNYINPSKEREWLREHFLDMWCFNFVFIVILLFFLSTAIRNWKGLAEE
ncbi:conserved membrane hypothetical protein [Flavobacterium sp. 9AF]|uniref:hypothetical protein n=1 Tax=Flavobacterium sp. 9AF TaxID=2653142 RepID=UPI0012F4764A|nr:hypothetical protein [Flavobacterium sp. 9AF]VXB66428.1 conserved membrane hypothetical protein [Flavobacterium sp. 9AF]